MIDIIQSFLKAGIWLIYPIFAMYTPKYTCRETGQESCYTDDNKTACNKFEFNFNGSESRNDQIMSSLVSDHHLVCDLAWAVPFSIAIKTVTILIGNTIGSIISDKYGRRTAMMLSSVGVVLFSFPLLTVFISS